MAEQIDGRAPGVGKKRGQPSAPKLGLWFTGEPELRLIKTEFTHRLLGGATLRAGVLDRKRSFSWSKGVRATSALLLRWAAWGLQLKSSPRAKMPILGGVRHSPAATLNDLLTRDPTWVSDVFGRGAEGRCLLDEMVTRINRDFKKVKDGPVTVALKPRLLPPDCIEVWVGGVAVTDANQLRRMAAEIERQVWPDNKGYRWDATIGDEEAQLSPASSGGPEQEPKSSPTAIPAGLRPYWISFDTLIQERARDFVGREFVFKALDAFLDELPSGYFIVEGEPGIGKSAIVASVVRNAKYACDVYHFNSSAEGITSADKLLGNVCARLVLSYGLPLDELPAGFHDDSSFLLDTLSRVSQNLAAGKRLLIAVDALDEAANAPGNANPLYLPISLPKGVYILATSRPGWQSRFRLEQVRCLALDPLSEDNERDIEEFVRARARCPRLKSWLSDRSITPESFTRTMAAKSRGNFMYLRYVLEEMERGAYRDLRIDQLPIGLESYYDENWRRMGMTGKPLPRTRIKVIYVLSSLTKPVSRELLANLAGEDEFAVQELLDDFRQLLSRSSICGQAMYSLYHVSFRDFLHRKEIVEAAGVTLKGINDLISRNLLGEASAL